MLVLAFVAPAAAQMQGQACNLSDADRIRAVAQAAEPLVAAKKQADAMRDRQLACTKLEGTAARIACVGANAPTIKPTLENLVAQTKAFLAEYDRLCAGPADVRGQDEFIVALVGNRNANPTDGPASDEPSPPGGIEQPGLPVDGAPVGDGPITPDGNGGATTPGGPIGPDTGNGGTNVVEGPVTGDGDGSDGGTASDGGGSTEGSGTTDGGPDGGPESGEPSYDPATDPFAPPDYSSGALEPFVPSAESSRVDPGSSSTPYPISLGPGATIGNPENLPINDEMVCGPDITRQVFDVLGRMRATFQRRTPQQKFDGCRALVTLPLGPGAWDIAQLAPPLESKDKTYVQPWFSTYGKQCAKPLDSICGPTVTFLGTCQNAQVVNYSQWGAMRRLCGGYFENLQMGAFHRIRNWIIAAWSAMPWSKGGSPPTDAQLNAVDFGYDLMTQLEHGVPDEEALGVEFRDRDRNIDKPQRQCSLTCKLDALHQRMMDMTEFDYHWAIIHE